MNQDRPNKLGRRVVLGGTAVAGGLAAVAAVMPRQPEVAQATAAADVKPDEPQQGYQLTEHVKRYYATARI